MAMQTSLNDLSLNDFSPLGKSARPNTAPDKAQEANADSQPQWVENAPSFLEAVQATLATLTEEEKEAIHLSLQK